MAITIEEKRLRKMIKQAMTEALEENIEKLKLGLIPYVSNKEMNEIRKIFGAPEKYRHQVFKGIEI